MKHWAILILALLFSSTSQANSLESLDVPVAACTKLGSGKEPCFYRFAWDKATCGKTACDKMIIYFSGGQMTCPRVANPSAALAYYAKRGYVSVCAKIYDSGSESGLVPFSKEGSRVTTLLDAITMSVAIKKLWNGKELLVSGISHGATAPMFALWEKTPLKDRPQWMGKKKTAACFVDGVMDAKYQLTFLYDNECSGLKSILSYPREYARYKTWPVGKFAGKAKWPAPDTMPAETIQDDRFEVTDKKASWIGSWHLLECGSAMKPCWQDVVPQEPIKAACDSISKQKPGSCTMGSYPDVGHIGCGLSEKVFADCAEWFEKAPDDFR